MALTKLSCPHCKVDLKPPKPVPEGAKLKCPKCKKGFTACQRPADDDLILIDDDDAPLQVGGIVEEVEQPAGKKKSAAADEIDVIDLLGDDSPPAKKKGKEPPRKASPDKKAGKSPLLNSDGEEGNDAGATYGLAAGEEDEHEEEEAPRGKRGKGAATKKSKKPEIDHVPDMSPRDPRGPAQEKVIICTNYMLLSAIIGFFGYMGLIIAIMIPAVTPLQSDAGTKESPVEMLTVNGGLGGASSPNDPNNAPGGAPPKEEKVKPSIFTVFDIDMAQFSYFGIGYFILILTPLVLGMIYSGVIAYGSVQTQSLESRPWGIVASVMNILSYHILGAAILLCWGLEILLVGILDSDKESLRYTQYGKIGGFIAAEIGIGLWVLLTLLQEDVVEGFEYKPE